MRNHPLQPRSEGFPGHQAHPGLGASRARSFLLAGGFSVGAKGIEPGSGPVPTRRPVCREHPLPRIEGDTTILNALVAETAACDGPVVLVHGDAHLLKIDEPLCGQLDLLPSFTRAQFFGSPNIHWVKVNLDPRSRNVFSFEPMIVVGN